MAQDDDKQRTKRDRIERLRKRLDELKLVAGSDAARLIAILKGLLDLLDDEL